MAISVLRDVLAIADLVKEIRKNQRIDILIPNDPQFRKWIKAKLMSKLEIATESFLLMALRRRYGSNPYQVALLLQDLVSEWYTENRSGYDSKTR